MEPIVPTPEERISRGNQGHKAARPAPMPSPRQASSTTPFRISKNALLSTLIGTVVIAAFGGLYVAQHKNISRVESILAGLDQTDLDKIRALQELHDSADYLNAVDKLAAQTLQATDTLAERISSLETNLARQGTDLEGLNRQVASISLSANASEHDSSGAVVDEIAALAGRVLSAEQTLEALTTDQTELRLKHEEEIAGLKKDQSKEFANHSSSLDDLSHQVAAIEQRFTIAGQELQRATNAISETLASLEQQSAAIASLEKRLDEQKHQSQTVLAKSSTQFSSQLDALKKELESSLTQTTAALDATFTRKLEERTSPLREHEVQLAALTKDLDEQRKQAARSDQDRAALSKQIASLQRELRETLNESQTALTAQFTVQLDEKAEALAKHNHRLGVVQTKLTSDLAAAHKKLGALEKQLVDAQQSLYATLSNQISAQLEENTKSFTSASEQRANTQMEMATALTAAQNKLASLEKQLAETRLRTQTLASRQQLASAADALKGEIASLNSKLEQSATTVQEHEQRLQAVQNNLTSEKQAQESAATTDALKKQVAILATKVEQSLATIKAHEQRIHRVQARLDEGLTQAATATSFDDSQLKALQAELANQATALKALRDRDNQLAREINASKNQLQTLHTSFNGLRQADSGSGAQALPLSELENVQSQIATLARHLENTRGRLDDNESQVLALREKVAAQLVSPPAGASNLQEIATIKETLKLLKGHHPYTKFPALD